MGDVSNWAFGDDTTTTQQSTQTAGQKSLLDQLTELLGGELGTGAETYAGDIAAGASPLQQTTFESITDLIAGGGDFSTALQQLLGSAEEKGGAAYAQGSEALTSMLKDYSPEETINLFKQYIEPEAYRMFEEELKPMVEGYVSKDATSSGAFNRALASAGTDFSTQLSALLGTMISGEKETHKGLQSTAISQAGDYYKAPYDVATQSFSSMLGAGGIQQALASLGLEAGATERDIEQDELTAGYSTWAAGQDWSNPWLQYIATALGVDTTAFTQEAGTSGAVSLSPLDMLSGSVTGLGKG